MEYIDIVDENNNPTGIIKEKEQAHKDGDFHRSTHIWIINNKKEVLLQKRGPNQKYSNQWDISSAGHIKYFSYEEFKEMVLSKDESLHYITYEEYEKILEYVKEIILG